MTLADKVNFPISNFTQVFLVVVLSGLGQIINILLYDDFKAALSQGIPKTKAARIARRFGGRTILYSGLSVLIGFSVLGLANFKFYRSAVGVAIGVLILLTVLLTLNMFFMATMGEKLFWPSKNLNGHSTSGLGMAFPSLPSRGRSSRWASSALSPFVSVERQPDAEL